MSDIWREYEKGQNWNNSINLYETVKKNEEFFLGDQWRGLNAPDLDKPVLNFLKRVVCYFVSQIVSDDVGITLKSAGAVEEGEINPDKVLTNEIEKIIEDAKIGAKNRDIIRDAAVDGDGCLYLYYDVDSAKVKAETVDNTRVIFGNPYDNDLQSQPYIIIVKPMQLATVRKWAEEIGVDGSEIVPDYEGYKETDNTYGDDRVTVLTKFWKDKGTVWFTTITKNVVLKEECDTGYKRYPLAYMQWDRVKNQYHGQAAVTGLIPNQIITNKLWAMGARHQQMNAFPKVFYDRTKIPKWTNRVGEAIAVNGSPTDTVAMPFKSNDMSTQVFDMVDRTVAMTRDFMGASDAALGNIKAENTSAIIAVQQASSAPLELQRLAFYQFVEDYVRIIIDIVNVEYGTREVRYEADNVSANVLVNFGDYDIDKMELQIDVGESAYWSELKQMQTLDNLYQQGIVTDPLIYIDGVPNKYLRNKSKIKERLMQAKQLQNMQQMNPIMSNGESEVMERDALDRGQDRVALEQDKLAQRLG